MRKIVAMALLAGVLAAAGAQAQDLDSYIELARRDLAADKAAVLGEALELTEAEAEAFWPVHREYQLKLDELGDQYLGIIKDYAASWETLTDAQAVDLVERAFKYKERRLDLQKGYFKRFAKLIPPVKAARWAQLENQIGLLVELRVSAEIPLAR